MIRHKTGLGRMAWLTVLGLVLAPWGVRADEQGKESSPRSAAKEKAKPGEKGDKGKGPKADAKAEKGDAAKKEEVEQARAEVRDLMKQWQEDGEKLHKAMGRLAELEGRPAMPPVGAMPAVPWGWPGWGMAPGPWGQGPGRDRTTELEKKVDRLAKELEELKKELKK